MLHATRFYDLSYTFPDKKKGTKPQIVLSIDESNFGEVARRLSVLANRESNQTYFGIEKAFTMPFPDLFGHTEFGFSACGLLFQHDRQVRFAIELSEAKKFEAARTLHFLTVAMAVPTESSGWVSNHRQQLELSTVCDHTRFAYGHAVGGRVSFEMLVWLRQYASKSNESNSVPVPAIVVKAMRTAWVALAKKDSRRWASECGGRIARDGRFGLDCFGNACDLAIYPSSFSASRRYGVEFGCHNLDTAAQQLTLIAGLAKLCELARQNE